MSKELRLLPDFGYRTAALIQSRKTSLHCCFSSARTLCAGRAMSLCYKWQPGWSPVSLKKTGRHHHSSTLPVLKASLPKNTRRSSCFLPTYVPLADVIMSSDKISPICQCASADEAKPYKSNWISKHRHVEIYTLHMEFSKQKIYSDTEVINLRGSRHTSSWWTAGCLMLNMINRTDTNWLLNATFMHKFSEFYVEKSVEKLII